MADRAVSPCPDELLQPGELARVCDLLVRAAESADGARIVRLRHPPADAGELEIGVRPLLSSGHPVDELVGMAAPSSWLAVGVSARGRMLAVDDPEAAPVPVHTAHLVGRDGAWASRWLSPAADGSAQGPAGDPTAPTGRVDDACRRALGLCTSPPDLSTVLLWAVLWLDAVVEAATSGPGRPSLRQWSGVAARHPAAAGHAPVRSVDSPNEFVRRGWRLAARRGWSQLRLDCAAGRWSSPGVEPSAAAWLDDGAFARWVLGALPELDDLRAATGVLLAPPLAAEIDVVLAAWQLGETTP